MKEWTIRKASIEELDRLIDLRLSLFESMGYTDPDALEKTDRACRWYFERHMPTDAFRVWVAETADQTVASIGLVIHSVPPGPSNLLGKVGYIMNLVVIPAFRHQGIGRALMEHVLNVLDAENVSIATLHATSDGRPLYERLGFAVDDHLPEMRRNA